MIYLDNAATTKPSDKVCSEMNRVMEDFWANPASSHKIGISANKYYEESKKKISEILDLKNNDIIFTSGATESINTVLKGFWVSYPHSGKHIITCQTEHQATLESCKYMESHGISVTYLPVDKYGKISSKSLIDAIRPDTSMFSFLIVNNETGTILDAREIVKIRNSINKDIKIHFDGVQALGKIDCSIECADYLSFSAHKLHGPKGVGLIIKNKNAKLSPLIHGGGQQEDLRSGTANLPGIAGFAAAIEDGCINIDRNYKKIKILNTMIKNILKEEVPEILFNSPDDASPYILNVSIPGVMGEVIVRMLESHDIFVSTSSACKSQNKNKSHVLSAMGINNKFIKGTLRISLSHYNSLEDIKYFCDKLKLSVQSFKRK